MRTSNPAHAERGFGGVARNVAENLARLGVQVAFCGTVGNDDAGRDLVRHLQAAGCDVGGVRAVDGAVTAQYVAIIAADGELVVAAFDSGVLESTTLADLENWMGFAVGAAWLVVDCNLPAPLLADVIERRRHSRWRLAVDGTSVAKVSRLPKDLSPVDVLFVNEAEARTHGVRGAKAIVTSRGARGILLHAEGGLAEIPPPSVQNVVDVTGAGDALLAGTLQGLIDGKPLHEALTRATTLAARTLQSPTAVP